MKANDLMVGNHVSTPDNIIKIAAIHNKKVAYHKQDDKLTWVRIGLIKPIPITADILKQNGFEQCDETDWELSIYEDNNPSKPMLYRIIWSAPKLYPNDNYLEIYDLKGAAHFFKFGICYIHQLQQILKLYNIDKEITIFN